MWLPTCLCPPDTTPRSRRLRSTPLHHLLRDKELAKFEAFLNKEQCMHINALVRNRSRLAYPMKGTQWEGIYVLYTYAAKRSTARAVQQLLSNPEAGSEDILLRFTTFCKW